MTIEEIGQLEQGDVLVAPTGIGNDKSMVVFMGMIDGLPMFANIFPMPQTALLSYTKVRGVEG